MSSKSRQKQISSSQSPVFLTEAELAARWRHSLRSLQRWRADGNGPPLPPDRAADRLQDRGRRGLRGEPGGRGMIPAVHHAARAGDRPRGDPAGSRRSPSTGLAGFVDVRLLTDKGTPDQPPQCYSLAGRRPPGSGAGPLRRRGAHDRPRLLRRPGHRRRSGGGPGDQSVTETAVIVVDLDDGDIEAKRAHLVEHLGAPTLVVASGGVTEAGEPKLHLYWRLARAGHGRRPRSGPQGAGDRRPQGRRRPLGRQGPAADPPRRLGALQARPPQRRCASSRTPIGSTRLDALERAVEAMPPIETGRRGRGGRRDRGGASGGSDPRRRRGRHHPLRRPLPLHRRAGPEGPAWADDAGRGLAGGRQVQRRVDRPELGGDAAPARVRGARTRRPAQPRRPARRRPTTLDRTEHGLARRLADEHAAEWRHVPGIGWLAWTGSYWRPDETGRILELCRRLCEDAAARAV